VTFTKDMGSRGAADQFRYECFNEHVRRREPTFAEDNNNEAYG
jgi:hypothetical protein